MRAGSRPAITAAMENNKSPNTHNLRNIKRINIHIIQMEIWIYRLGPMRALEIIFFFIFTNFLVIDFRQFTSKFYNFENITNKF